ncbi:50S ribosomal protein L9 [Metamycoplasma alkalescens]|uniref:Large ribosomal subunit protein bL9 n=1 Tax=Metamycoplasma alkalescens TaxID=45363 RepID=A0A318U7T8_9BACT|nr:50S ribosomal protein L9 [Metamycoplasma alkalescens]PYF42604.1 large subunit ribosomal protein L9 [Metamycoplasma alkalescens]SYV90339.1 50S ribosomal protein L9 [Metamycoplasma alkalescens]
MKVIIIKQYQNYKLNEIVEVNDGFAKNFLIKNGYAQPFNKQTLANLERVKKHIKEDYQKEIAEATKIKEKIELLTLNFSLKSNRNVVHGSITNKAIEKELLKKNIKIGPHALGKASYNTFGRHYINVKLHDEVTAILLIEIFEEK